MHHVHSQGRVSDKKTSTDKSPKKVLLNAHEQKGIVRLRRVGEGIARKLFVVGPSYLIFETKFRDCLLSGAKIMTTRLPKAQWLRGHMREYNNGALVKIWCGGQGVILGHGLYRCVKTRKLADFTELDMELEGFGSSGLSAKHLKGYSHPLQPRDFVSLVFGEHCSLQTIAHTFLFQFFPLPNK
jgi:hypothetical protein